MAIMAIIIGLSMIEDGRMPGRPGVWAIQYLLHFSKRFVRAQEDKDEQGVLPVIPFFNFCPSIQPFKS